MVKFKIGDIVQSDYRNNWHGTVIKVEKRINEGDLITAQLTHDACRVPYKRKQIQTLDESWLYFVSDDPTFWEREERVGK